MQKLSLFPGALDTKATPSNVGSRRNCFEHFTRTSELFEGPERRRTLSPWRRAACCYLDKFQIRSSVRGVYGTRSAVRQTAENNRGLSRAPFMNFSDFGINWTARCCCADCFAETIPKPKFSRSPRILEIFEDVRSPNVFRALYISRV